jgi:hypothetical protein
MLSRDVLATRLVTSLYTLSYSMMLSDTAKILSDPNLSQA